MGQIELRRREGRTLPPFTVLRCPLEGHQVSWCRCLCRPQNGHGFCGRLAPHALGMDRTQLAIARYRERAAREGA